MSQITRKDILDKIDDPEGLENLFRSDPEPFREVILSLPEGEAGSGLLKFWRARLEYAGKVLLRPGVPLLIVFLIAVILGSFVRIPAAFLTEQWYYPRFAPFLTLLAVAAYFLVKQQNRTLTIALAEFGVLTSLYLFLLPDVQTSDSVAMALIHLPLTTLAVLGMAFVQEGWRESGQRIAFIRFGGELLVFTTLILIGGGVLSAFVMGLFELMGINIHFEEWYMRNIGVFGLVSAPLVATYFYDSVLRRRLHIMEFLARIFAPLFCIFVFTYLGVMMYLGNNPFVNREFLVVFNGLLILILGIVIFSTVHRNRETGISVFDYVNILMIAGSIIINLLALSVIIFRLAEYGLSPNRFCVLGVNIIVFVHLGLILSAYVQVLRKRSDMSLIRERVTGYFPVYVGWFVFVTYLLPLIFGFV